MYSQVRNGRPGEPMPNYGMRRKRWKRKERKRKILAACRVSCWFRSPADTILRAVTLRGRSTECGSHNRMSGIIKRLFLPFLLIFRHCRARGPRCIERSSARWPSFALQRSGRPCARSVKEDFFYCDIFLVSWTLIALFPFKLRRNKTRLDQRRELNKPGFNDSPSLSQRI